VVAEQGGVAAVEDVNDSGLTGRINNKILSLVPGNAPGIFCETFRSSILLIEIQNRKLFVADSNETKTRSFIKKAFRKSFRKALKKPSISLLLNQHTIRSTHIPYSNIFTIPFLKHGDIISRVNWIIGRINNLKMTNFYNQISII
jgi:hypothetical protein